MSGTATASAVRLERSGTVLFIVIDNPPVNAGSLSVRRGLVDAVRELADDADLQAGVVIGAGMTFVAGSDLREFSLPLLDPQMPAVVSAIEDCPKPIVAAIDGAALGGGFEIALGCDARIATATAVVGLPEGTFGLIPGAGGTVRLPRLTDLATALEIVASARRVPAREAVALGLIDVIASDLRGDAAAMALSLAGGKRKVRDLPPHPFDADGFEAAATTALRRGRGRPFVREQVEAMRRAAVEPVEQALRMEREVFQRLREGEESAALRHLFFARRAAAKVDRLAAVAPLPMRTIGIVGAGTMGTGIAASFLRAGLTVRLADPAEGALGTAATRIEGFLGVEGTTLETLSLHQGMEALSDCDLVLEAVFEDIAVKREVMNRLGAVARPGAVIASNTSYLDLDVLAQATGRPESVVGFHFFAPAHAMKLLEIVRGERTGPEVLRTALALAERLDKVAVVSRVGDGFIGNRIYNRYRAECEALLLEGLLPQEVDEAIEAFGFRMGPFAVSDLSGLDIAWANRKRNQERTGKTSADLPVLEWLVGAGRLGRKTGAGWYAYEDGRRMADPFVEELVQKARTERGVEGAPVPGEVVQRRAMLALVNESLLVLGDGIAARASDIDLVLANGYGFPAHRGGPLFWARQQDRGGLAQDLAAISGGRRRGDLSLLDRTAS